MKRHLTPEIPADVHEHLTAAENTEKAVDAMKSFLRDGDEEKFELAVALYVASARFRQEQIENVTGALCTLAGSVEGPQADDFFAVRPTRLHRLIFSGILRAFYGDDAVERALGASAQRKADAPQHTRTGTWPMKPAE